MDTLRKHYMYLLKNIALKNIDGRYLLFIIYFIGIKQPCIFCKESLSIY